MYKLHNVLVHTYIFVIFHRIPARNLSRNPQEQTLPIVIPIEDQKGFDVMSRSFFPQP